MYAPTPAQHTRSRMGVDSEASTIQAWPVAVELAGTWKLVAWRRVADDGSLTYPLGEDATGLLIYTGNGRMAVQITAANRPALATNDPLGGDVEKRADAYSGCLAYFGTYEVQDDKVVHHVDKSLFPNWSGAEQVRPLSFEGQE